LVLLAAAGASAQGHARTKIRTDGLLTVGGQETITVTNVPRRRHMRLRAFIDPPLAAGLCNVEPPIESELFSPCLQEPLQPVPGTRNLKRSKKGRATLTFVMPAAYEYIDINDPVRSHPIALVDGQTVGVDVSIVFRPEPRTIVSGSLAFASVVVQVPPPPSG
jgi:hypothetical protein